MQDREDMNGCMQPVAILLGIVFVIVGVFAISVAPMSLWFIWVGCMLIYGGVRGVWFY